MKISKTYHRTKTGQIKRNPVMSREKKIDSIINKIQESAFIQIEDTSFAKHLMMERMSSELINSSFWDYLSKDKSSGKLFQYNEVDPTLTVVFVDINYLRRTRGNKIYQNENDGGIGKSVDKVLEIIKSNNKLRSVPIFYLRDNEVGEGNHRIEALYQLGYKSVPVYLTQGWD